MHPARHANPEFLNPNKQRVCDIETRRKPILAVNCPFDADYKSIMRAVLFCLVQFGFKP